MRYSAQRYGTWEWLDLELPLDTDGPEWVLSSYGIMEATIAPEIGIQKAYDGRPLFEEWSTIIHFETEGDQRRWTGIVVRSELDGKEWRITVHEFPGYLQGTPVESLIRGVEADPADLARQLWQDVQSMPSAWLGVTVVGKTDTKIGTNSDDLLAVARATMDGLKEAADKASKDKNKETGELQDLTATLADEVAQARKQITEGQATVDALIRGNAPQAQIELAREVVSNRQAFLTVILLAYKAETDAKKAGLAAAKKSKDSAQKASDKAREAYDKAKEKAQEDGGAYEIRFEDTPDAFDALADLCDVSGMEWTTATKYTDGPPELTINIHYPAAGTAREDLVFEQGVNIVNELQLVRNGEEYANAANGIGSGEGEAAVRASIASATDRMRRVTVVEDKSLKTEEQLLAAMRKELSAKTGEPFVAEIDVVDTDMAPMFSWNLGDIITVSGNVPHYGRYAKPHRIISWQLIGMHIAKIKLELV